MKNKNEMVNDRQTRIADKKAQIEAYRKHPLATIDVVFQLEFELKQIYDEILETPFQMVTLGEQPLFAQKHVNAINKQNAKMPKQILNMLS